MSKTIAAFDVAVKTLSFCLIEYQLPSNSNKILQNNLKFNLRKWVVVNLLENDTRACSFVKKSHSKKTHTDSETLCTHKATFSYQPSGNENQYYCGVHIKNVPDSEKMKIKEIVVKNTKTTPVRDININLVRELDKYPELLEVDEIIIENQHAKRSLNAKMISISAEIYFYFLIRGVVDKVNSTLDIRYVPANNNLSTAGHINFKVTSLTHPDAYKCKKAQSIEYAAHILSLVDVDVNQFSFGDIHTAAEWLAWFQQHHKMDDLADSLTHAYSAIVKEFCVYTDFKTKQQRNQRKNTGRNRIVDPSEIIKL